MVTPFHALANMIEEEGEEEEQEGGQEEEQQIQEVEQQVQDEVGRMKRKRSSLTRRRRRKRVDSDLVGGEVPKEEDGELKKEGVEINENHSLTTGKIPSICSNRINMGRKYYVSCLKVNSVVPVSVGEASRILTFFVDTGADISVVSEKDAGSAPRRKLERPIDVSGFDGVRNLRIEE